MGLLNFSESGAVLLLLGIAVFAAVVWLVMKRFALVVQIVFALVFGFECVIATQVLVSGTELSQALVADLKLVQFLSLIYAVAAVLAVVGRIRSRDVFILLTVLPFMYARIYPDITLQAAFFIPLPHFAFGVFGLVSATSA